MKNINNQVIKIPMPMYFKIKQMARNSSISIGKKVTIAQKTEEMILVGISLLIQGNRIKPIGYFETAGVNVSIPIEQHFEIEKLADADTFHDKIKKRIPDKYIEALTLGMKEAGEKV